MFHRFRYESEYYPSLSRLPLDVRRKLDIVGIKISLKDWLAFSLEERIALCHLPVEQADEQQAFHAYLDFLSRKYLGGPAKKTEPLSVALWNTASVPEPVVSKSAESNAVVTAQEWAQWQTQDRYALFKTATSTSQPEAFAQVVDELRGRRNPQAKGDR
ncbi:MAG TPA: nitrate reductase associated protein [Terriglobales bacterium]|jgi:hypothetical protein|nr:nitrate reductase associated protein [Terriglobales bacterium]